MVSMIFQKKNTTKIGGEINHTCLHLPPADISGNGVTTSSACNKLLDFLSAHTLHTFSLSAS